MKNKLLIVSSLVLLHSSMYTWFEPSEHEHGFLGGTIVTVGTLGAIDGYGDRDNNYEPNDNNNDQQSADNKTSDTLKNKPWYKKSYKKMSAEEKKEKKRMLQEQLDALNAE